LKRTLTAQLDIAAALNLTVDPTIVDIAAHLPPFNTAVCSASGSTNLQSGATCEPGQRLWTQCGTGTMTRVGDDKIEASDGFSLYPLFPAEVVTTNSSAAELKIARDSVAYYTQLADQGADSSLCNIVHVFSMMVRSGFPASHTLAYLKQFL